IHLVEKVIEHSDVFQSILLKTSSELFPNRFRHNVPKSIPDKTKQAVMPRIFHRDLTAFVYFRADPARA
ncbi:hypothetical protein, partial [Faecalibaculum rodentium]|uniref:hypothetical protein n=1 Tax=Faecalibaculum rodentium TaxID=1702221 RepID=UPI0023F59618